MGPADRRGADSAELFTAARDPQTALRSRLSCPRVMAIIPGRWHLTAIIVERRHETFGSP